MVYFIAEVSSNHAQDLDRCLKFVDTAAEIGCDAVKFQLFRVDELFSPEILAKSPRHRARKAWELPETFLAPIAGRCRNREIEFVCTPFFLHAVALLRPYVDRYKVASYELLWHDLIRACTATGKPLLLSTGMATLDEIAAAVAAARAGGGGEANLTLLQCVSGYPTPAAEANLAALETMGRTFGVPTGWSDHTVRPAVIQRAVHRWGAVAVEFHLDLDGSGDEFATGHCWLPEPAAAMIAGIREGLGADGSGEKRPMPAERADRDWRADPDDGLRPLQPLRTHWEPEP
ncbi:MAG: N-acetylneuraminate synthase family protein [Rhodospirillaceae bacterium]